jgi:hypothetical protein
MLASTTPGGIEMNIFNHSRYESVKFCDDNLGVIDTHGFRIRIRMHIPEQKIVHWNELFSGNKTESSQVENKNNH